MSEGQVVGSTFLEGLKSPNYVNGRLLTAEDLQTEQRTVQARLAALGRAVGDGVVKGLEVRSGARQVTVTEGLGLNREGALVRLPRDVTLSISPEAGGAGGASHDSGFEPCAKPVFAAAGSHVDAGAYVLTARPASQLDGRVPVKSATTAPAGCSGKWVVDGVEFRAFRLSDPVGQDFSAHMRRNLLAHWCFGTAALATAPIDPFSFASTWSGLDTVGIPPADLPLAVFWWTGSAIEFLDVWSARRRVVSPGALNGWHAFLSDGRVADSQARFLQFQQHVGELVASGVAPGTVAVDTFRFLPPAGFLPLKPKSLLDRLDVTAGGPLVKPRNPLFAWDPLLDVLKEEGPEVGRAAHLPLTAYLRGGDDPTLLTRLLSDVQDELSTARRGRFATRGRAAVEEVEEAEAVPEVSKNRQKRQAARDRVLSRRRNAFRLALRTSPWGTGFDLKTFFGQLPTRIGLVDRETVDFTLQRSWFDEPIDLRPPSGARPVINVFMVEDAVADRQTPPYVLFSKAIKPISWLAVGDD